MLYRHFFGFGMSVCLRYAYSREEALEILNDGFMKVFDNIKVFDDGRPFKSWFRKILVNTALDHYRANRTYRINVSLEDLKDETGDLSEDVSSLEAGIEINSELILRLFSRLPETYRLTFNMYEIEGYSHDEIAAMLGISPGTSRSNLSRAKKMLRLLYAQSQNKTRHEAV